MKRLTKALISILVTSVITIPTLAGSISLRIDNQLIVPAVAPYESEGTTLVPLRIVSEELGAKVDWNQKDQVITIIQADTTISLTVGSKTAKVNGVAKELLLASQVNNNTTMVPIRFVSENLNCNVNWDKVSQTVSVNGKDVPYEEIKGEKVTTFKNPKVINGVVYLTKEQIVEAFNVEIEMQLPHTAQITRKDFHCWLLGKDWVAQKNIKVGDGGNRINWAYLPLEEGNNNLWIKESNTFYYPLEYLAKYLNSKVAYNATNKEVTIVNSGIKRVETVDTDKTTLSGYVYYPDGTPAVGIRLGIIDVSVYKVLAGDIFTDENGYYEIKNFDCKKYSRVRSTMAFETIKSKDGKNYTGQIPSFATINDDVQFGFYTNVTKLPDTIIYVTTAK